MLLTYSLTKAECALCDVAQFVVHSLGWASLVHSILTTVMTHIPVDKSTDHAIPHSICFLAELQRAKRASEAPWVRKIGNPSSKENLVMTSAYDRASERATVRTDSGEGE